LRLKVNHRARKRKPYVLLGLDVGHRALEVVELLQQVRANARHSLQADSVEARSVGDEMNSQSRQMETELSQTDLEAQALNVGTDVVRGARAVHIRLRQEPEI
jgi:hypothetical protein